MKCRCGFRDSFLLCLHVRLCVSMPKECNCLANRHALVNPLLEPAYGHNIAFRIEPVVIIGPSRGENCITPLPGVQGDCSNPRLLYHRFRIEEWRIGVVLHIQPSIMSLTYSHT